MYCMFVLDFKSKVKIKGEVREHCTACLIWISNQNTEKESLNIVFDEEMI